MEVYRLLWLRALFSIGIVASCAGCGLATMLFSLAEKPACQLPKSFRLMLVASERVNLDEEGRSIPVSVSVMQLASLDHLESSTYDDIWLRADETLQDQLLKKTQQTIYPGESLKRALEVDLDPKTRFIVAAAFFREPGGVTWRATYEVPVTEVEVCKAESDGIYLRYIAQDSQIEGGEESPPEEESKDTP